MGTVLEDLRKVAMDARERTGDKRTEVHTLVEKLTGQIVQMDITVCDNIYKIVDSALGLCGQIKAGVEEIGSLLEGEQAAWNSIVVHRKGMKE